MAQWIHASIFRECLRECFRSWRGSGFVQPNRINSTLQEKSTGLRGYPILGSRSYVSCSANYSLTTIFSIRVIYHATLRLAARKKLLHTLWTHLRNGARWDLDPGLPAHISDPRQFGVDCLHVVNPDGSVTLRLILPKKATIEP